TFSGAMGISCTMSPPGFGKDGSNIAKTWLRDSRTRRRPLLGYCVARTSANSWCVSRIPLHDPLAVPINVCFEGKAEMASDVTECLLLTQSGHSFDLRVAKQILCTNEVQRIAHVTTNLLLRRTQKMTLGTRSFPTQAKGNRKSLNPECSGANGMAFAFSDAAANINTRTTARESIS